MAAGPIRVCNAHGRGRRINSGGNALVPVVSPPPYHAFDTSSTSPPPGPMSPAWALLKRRRPDWRLIALSLLKWPWHGDVTMRGRKPPPPPRPAGPDMAAAAMVAAAKHPEKMAFP